MTLKDLNSEENYLNEGPMMDMVRGVFFVDTKNSITTTPVKTPRTSYKDNEEEAPAEPFAGKCKYMKTVLIPEDADHRNNDRKLLAAASKIFTSSWVEKPELKDCVTEVLTHLLRHYFEEHRESFKDMDMDIIGDAVVTGKLDYDQAQKDYKVVSRVYKRISHHKDNMFSDLMHPKPGVSFEKRWKEASGKFTTAIQNILKTGGDTNLFLGVAKADTDDKDSKKK